MNLSFLLLSALALLCTLLPQAASVSPQNGTGVSSKNSLPGVFSIGLVAYQGKFYTGNMTFGNSRMDMRLIIDSGSSDLWVASTWCDTYTDICGYRKYDCNPADGCYQTDPDLYRTKLGTKEMDIIYYYPLGSITATVTTVPIGLDNTTFLSVNSTTVGMLNDSSEIFDDYDEGFDGILGLGRPENLDVVYTVIPPEPVTTPFQQLLLAWKASPEFFVYLHQNTGMLDLTGPDSTHYHEPLKPYIGASPYLWMLLAEKIVFDKLEWFQQSCEFNTAWYKIGIPANILKQISEDTGAIHDYLYSRYIIECPSEPDQYPTFYFTFNGDTYSIDQSLYINPTVLFGNYCQMLVTDSLGSYWILGLPWFQKYYTGFSFGSNTISLAQSV